MATPSALSPKIRAIVAAGETVPGGVIGFEHTIFLWQSFAAVGIELVVVTLVMWLAAPTGERARDAQALGIDLPPADLEAPPAPKTPGERLEHSPFVLLGVALTGVV